MIETSVLKQSKFPEWAPKELVSTYYNAEEPDLVKDKPILYRLLTVPDMQFTWEKLRKAGMTDSPFGDVETYFGGVKGKGYGYTYVLNSLKFKKSPQGLYEYICTIKKLREERYLRSKKKNDSILDELKLAAKTMLALIDKSGFDTDHQIISEYAKVRKAEHRHAESKERLIEHLKNTRTKAQSIDEPEISMTDLINEYIIVLTNAEQLTKFYYLPGPTKAGEPTYFVVKLSHFMHDFYGRPLDKVVANLTNTILSLSFDECFKHRVRECSKCSKPLTEDDVPNLIKAYNKSISKR